MSRHTYIIRSGSNWRDPALLPSQPMSHKTWVIKIPRKKASSKLRTMKVNVKTTYLLDPEAILLSVLRVLNDAYQLDPVAMLALIGNRVPCSPALAAHPKVQVWSADPVGKGYMVGMMGILNAIVEEITGFRVATQWRNRKFLGFAKYESPQQKATIPADQLTKIFKKPSKARIKKIRAATAAHLKKLRASKL